MIHFLQMDPIFNLSVYMIYEQYCSPPQGAVPDLLDTNGQKLQYKLLSFH